MSLLLERVANRINRRKLSDLEPFRERYSLTEYEARLYFGLVNMFNDKGGESFAETTTDEILDYTGVGKTLYVLRMNTLVKRRLILKNKRRNLNGWYFEFAITNTGLSFLQHNL